MKSYVLHIRLDRSCRIQVGKLGLFFFPAGIYTYVGSARRGIEARISRHRSKIKKLRWHIDYLLNCPEVRITNIMLSNQNECTVNEAIQGEIVVKGFGASDCRRGCKSHLKRDIKCCR